MADSISHLLTAAIKFSCYSSNEIGLLCFFFLFLALALSLLATPMKTLKLSRKKESASLLLFFISKSPGSCAIYCRNARVLEMQNFTPAYMKGWTYVRTIFSEPKFLGFIDNQIFLPMVLRCVRFACERAPHFPKLKQIFLGKETRLDRLCFSLLEDYF